MTCYAQYELGSSSTTSSCRAVVVLKSWNRCSGALSVPELVVQLACCLSNTSLDSGEPCKEELSRFGISIPDALILLFCADAVLIWCERKCIMIGTNMMRSMERQMQLIKITCKKYLAFELSLEIRKRTGNPTNTISHHPKRAIPRCFASLYSSLMSFAL